MDTKTQIVISFSDLKKALTKKWPYILLMAIFCAFFSFLFQLKKPLTYTAEGVFKGGTLQTNSGLTRALELLGGGESYTPRDDDPKTFLRCIPVMENVARTLNLQVKVSDPKQTHSRFKNLWSRWKAETAYRKQNKSRPDAFIGSANAIAVTRPFYQESHPVLECAHVEYAGELVRCFSVHFVSLDCFDIFEGKKKISFGKLDVPCYLDNCKITLSSKNTNLIHKTFLVSMVPLEFAAKSLSENLIVKIDRDNPSLYRIRCTHGDPHLATAIVNAAMIEFQNYLKEEGKQKIAKQLGYLKQRQSDAFHDLENEMEKHKSYLEHHVSEGGLVLLEKELDFFANSQAHLQSELNGILLEIYDLQKGHPLYGSFSFSNLMAFFLKEKTKWGKTTLTHEAARALLSEYQRELERLNLEKKQYETFSRKLLEPQFEASSFSNVFSDATISSRLAKIHGFQRNLADEKNWTEKEKTNLKAELETEKRFLMSHFSNLIKGADIQELLLKDQIFSLRETLLALLCERYESIEQNFKNLSQKAQYFPEKWLTEQKIDLNTKMQKEMMESITKMIEAKNIGYHLEYSSSAPLLSAKKPLLPDHPRLFFYTKCGFGFGAFLAFLILVFQEAYLGPTASKQNLECYGKTVIGKFSNPSKEREKRTLRKLFDYLPPDKKHIALLMQKPSKLGEALFASLSKSGEIVLLQHFSNIQNALWDRDSYDRILTVLEASPSSLDAQDLIKKSDMILYLVHGERINEVLHLPSNCLFLCGPDPKKRKAPFLASSQILPLVENLFKKFSSFSFFSLRSPKNL